MSICRQGHFYDGLKMKKCKECRTPPPKPKKRVPFVLPADDERAVNYRTEAAKRGITLRLCA